MPATDGGPPPGPQGAVAAGHPLQRERRRRLHLPQRQQLAGQPNRHHGRQPDKAQGERLYDAGN